MEISFLAGLILLSLAMAEGQKKVCFAPVACSAGDVTSSEWMEIESKSQCTDKPSQGKNVTSRQERNVTQATIPESRIKTLINETVTKFRYELTNLLASKGSSNELKQLRNDVKEMNQTLNQMNATLERELAKIYETFQLLNDSLQPKQACPHAGNITYNSSCYWLILHNTSDVSFTRAQELCSQGGGSPGDILSQAHYDLIEMKFKEMSTTTKWFWIGMNIDPISKVVTLSNGTAAPFTKWYIGWPTSGITYSTMAVQIDLPPPEGGMFQWDPTASKSHGVLCQD